MPTWGQLGLQNAASPVMEEMISFHDLAMQLLVFIMTGVGCAMGDLMMNSFSDRFMLEGQAVECAWTVFPAIILIMLGMPSLMLLYMMDEAAQGSLTIKAVGHQWYWSYEYSDFLGAGQLAPTFDSYMMKGVGSVVRLLDVDFRLVLPVSTHIRTLITSSDVLHSWTIPAMGVKADACPGRLNQVSFIGHRSGVFFGQCSEICGANHSFMPIAAEVVAVSDFEKWIKNVL